MAKPLSAVLVYRQVVVLTVRARRPGSRRARNRPCICRDCSAVDLAAAGGRGGRGPELLRADLEPAVGSVDRRKAVEELLGPVAGDPDEHGQVAVGLVGSGREREPVHDLPPHGERRRELGPQLGQPGTGGEHDRLGAVRPGVGDDAAFAGRDDPLAGSEVGAVLARQPQLRGDGGFGPDEPGARLEHAALVAAQGERREALSQRGAVEHLVRDAVCLRRGDRRREEVVGAVRPAAAGDGDHHAAGDGEQLFAGEGLDLAPQLV